jgi:SAM-dependent methyltransferase
MMAVAMESAAPTSPGLPADVMAVLRCPHCGGTLEEKPGGLSCANCARTFPRVNGVVCFVEVQDYAGSFGFQWHKYARTQLDDVHSHESERMFRLKTGFTPAELSGKLILDVGCGMGRFAEVASRWGARVVGVDLSRAAEVAASNLADRENVAFLQANLFSLPFALESFDCIYSIGVLHHTPDCEKAFRSLLPFLKPGGRIAIWLYSGYNKWYRVSDFYRKFTSRLPNRWLLALCHVAVPLYPVHRLLRYVPILGRPLSALLSYLLPVSLQPKRDWRVLDTFDWYSPKYQSKHTYEEVSRWFESEGLDSVRVLFEPIALQGRKPSCGPEARREEASCVESQAS